MHELGRSARIVKQVIDRLPEGFQVLVKITLPISGFMHAKGGAKCFHGLHFFFFTGSINDRLGNENGLQHQRHLVDNGQFFFLVAGNETRKREDSIDFRHRSKALRQRIGSREIVGQHLDDVGRGVRVRQ